VGKFTGDGGVVPSAGKKELPSLLRGKVSKRNRVGGVLEDGFQTKRSGGKKVGIVPPALMLILEGEGKIGVCQH